MKRLFTLLLSLAIVGAVSAQRYNGPGNYAYGPDNNNGNYGRSNYEYLLRQRDADIQRINRDFAYKVEALRRDRWLSRRERNKRIEWLERDRDQQIRIVQERLNQNYNRRNDDRNYNYNKGRF